MKKPVFNKTGMKMLVTTGFKTFDKQTNYIGTGNVMANTQYSSFIRPWSETECNGFIRPCGELMYYDMKPFSEYRIPIPIRDIIEDKERKESVILYLFFIRRNHQLEPLCWVLTDYHHNLLKKYVWNWTVKRETAMLEIIKYITNEKQ